MSDLVVVSRSDVFGGSESDGHSSDDNDAEYEVPGGFDFDVVDVEAEEKGGSEIADKEQDIASEEPKMEYFPMFSTTEGEQQENLLKVNLTRDGENPDEALDDEFERTAKTQKRSDSYYFAIRDPQEEAKFEISAISGEKVIEMSKDVKFTDYKLINLKEYNMKVENELKTERAKTEKKRSARPSKKRRLAKIKAKELRKTLERARKLNEKRNQNRIRQRTQKQDQKRPVVKPSSVKKSANRGPGTKKKRRGGKKHKNTEKRPVFRTE